MWCACVEDCTVLLMQKVDDASFFDRTWAEFKAGFGDVDGNYWLGNELIHQLTKDDGYKLRIDLQVEKENWQRCWLWAEYSTFIVADEASKYRVTVSGYTGDAGDVLQDVDGKKFTTSDDDNDDYSEVNNAVDYGFGFWHDYNGAQCELLGDANYSYCAGLSIVHSHMITRKMWLQCK